MKILGYTALHYGAEFEMASLLSVRDHVDRFFICYSRQPSFGFESGFINPDREEEMRLGAELILGDKLIWESHDRFPDEGTHLDQHYRHCVGFDIALKIDFDEVFENLEQSIQYVMANSERFYHTKKYIHFWRSFDYCFTQDGHAPRRIEKLTANNTLENHNLPLTVYHMGWNQSLKTIRYKLSTFGHKAELRPNFLQEKFLAWTPDKIDQITWLHPVSDQIWEKPQYFDKTKLPESLRNHPRYLIGPEEDAIRVLLVPMAWDQHNNDPGLFGDMLREFRQLYPTMIYQGDLLVAAEFKPTLILFQADIAPDQLSALKLKTGAFVAMYSGDCSYCPSHSLMRYKDIIDCYLLPFSGELLETYQRLLGRPCHFHWEFIQDWRYKINQHETGISTVFVGNHYSHFPAERRDTLNYIQTNAPSGTIGNEESGLDWIKCNVRETPQIYNDAYIVICENNFHDIQDYFTPRNLGALAAGSCALMRWFPGIEKHFQHLHHCIIYKNKYEAVEWINFLRNNRKVRNNLAENGFKLAWEKFKMKNWVTEVMNILQTKHLL